MSDEGDRACPLCAEEMDLTDQQLKPCKCGYEICVWCWHHIMDMAEKDQTQGRCPACRNPYNKEKIVGTTAKCERLVAEMNMEKKTKSQKAKNKIFDGRKQLGNVRVIQKSLVYIVGLPLTLADEKLLQQRDYFGQYGRVLKVSISRTAAGTIQQFANDTCSVYITYSKEEEASRCIQSVHGFILDDRPLKACFGTTKYCHTWLRNMPCNNPDCLYLHEIGSQEDSFSKDDTAPAFTRVQQITGAVSTMHPCSGNVLPPPAEDISSSTLTGKPASKSVSNNISTCGNGSPPNSKGGRSTALPSAASWGARASNGNPPSGYVVSSPSKQKPETCSASAGFSTAVAATVEAPRVHTEMREKLIDDEENQNKSRKGRKEPPKSSRFTVNDTAREVSVDRRCPKSPKDKVIHVDPVDTKTTSPELAERSYRPCPENDPNVCAQGNSNTSSAPSPSPHQSNISVVHSHTQTEHDGSSRSVPDSPTPDCNIDNSLHVHPSGVSAELNGCPGELVHNHVDSGREVVHNHVDSGREVVHAKLKNSLVGRPEGEAVNIEQSVATDMGENKIISNILSLDFDPWDQSLTSQNLVKLLTEGDNERPLAPSNSWKVQNTNKSRFSFARPDEHIDLQSSTEPSFSHMQQMFKESPLRHDFAVNRDLNFDKFGDCNGFSNFMIEEPDNLARSCSYLSSNNFSGSRSQVSTPPGFSIPSKAPPPGFSLHERGGSSFNSVSGNHILDASSLLRNPYQSPQNGNISSSTDIEFMDPAILAVGVGRIPNGLSNDFSLDMRSNFSPQLNTFGIETGFQSLMQRSSPSVQNQRCAGMGNGYDPMNDTQSFVSNLSPFSQLSLQQPRNSLVPNGQWNGWSEGKSASDMGMAELLRTESLGFNKFYGGYEDLKFHMPSSGDIYNRTYGI